MIQACWTGTSVAGVQFRTQLIHGRLYALEMLDDL